MIMRGNAAMKKTLSLLLALLCLACLLAGCAEGGRPAGNQTTAPPPPDTTTEPPTEEVPTPGSLGLLTSGVLKVAMEIGYPPFEYYGDDGSTPMGLDVELAYAIGEILGVEVVLENTLFEGILEGLGVDRYDCVISAVTITGARMQQVDFSQSYIENWLAIVVKKGAHPVTSVEGLNGLNVGFQEGTTSREYMDELMGAGIVDCDIHPFDMMFNAFSDLKLGRLDAIMVDSTVAEGYLAREPDAYEITWIQSSDPGAEAETFGIAVKKGNQSLLDAVNNAMRQLEANGRLDEMRGEWLNEGLG